MVMDKNYTLENEEHPGILKTRTGLEIQKAKPGEDYDFWAYGICFSIDQTGESISSDAYDWQFETMKVFPSLYAHDKKIVIGNVRPFEKDATGWKCGFYLNQDLQAGRDALAMVKHGDITGVSQGFYSVGPEEDIIDPETGRIIDHRYTRCKLFEVSLVVTPAHDLARIIQINKEYQEKIENKELAAFLGATEVFLKRRIN